jgi:hypothetical protein
LDGIIGDLSMQTSQSLKKPRYNGAGIKFLISTLSLAVTIVFWNLFSNKDSSAVLFTQPEASTAQSAQVDVLSLPPLPTLTPVQLNLTAGRFSLLTLEQVPSLPIRNVGIPAAQPSGNGSSKSVFEFIAVNGPGGNGGGNTVGNGGGGATSTGSSR